MFSPQLDILLAEDDPVMRRMVMSFLQKLGIQKVRGVVDGKEALEAIVQHKPDVIITDWEMPRLNGYKLLQTIRGHDALKNIPVLMLTCRAEKEWVQMAVQEGSNGYIVKPFNVRKLATSFQKILS